MPGLAGELDQVAAGWRDVGIGAVLEKQQRDLLAATHRGRPQRSCARPPLDIDRHARIEQQAYDAGVFDLWEVGMSPPQGRFGMPLSVVVPARSNTEAAEFAARQNPGYVVGPMRVLPRRN